MNVIVCSPYELSSGDVKIEYISVSTLSISFKVTSNSHQPSLCHAKISHTCFYGNYRQAESEEP